MRIFGEEYYRRAEVSTIGGLSAHAGQNALVDYADATRSTLREVFLVHSEPDAAKALTQKMWERGIRHVKYPEYRETMEI